MPLRDPWTSGDGAEVSTWGGFREDILPHTKVGLNARTFSRRELSAPSGVCARVRKAPHLGPFCVPIEEESNV